RQRAQPVDAVQGLRHLPQSHPTAAAASRDHRRTGAATLPAADAVTAPPATMSVQILGKTSEYGFVGGRRRYNAGRRDRALLRRLEVRRLALELHWPEHGVQARIAERLGVSQATVSRDVAAVVIPRRCPTCDCELDARAVARLTRRGLLPRR